MRTPSFAGLLALLLVVCAAGTSRAVDYVDPVRPAKNKISGVDVGPAPATAKVQVPIITWGGDAATLHANGGMTTTTGSAFNQAGLNLQLVKQDDFVVQVQDYLSGKSPFVRGTMGMINTYSELLNASPDTQPVVVLQLTWSTGGDCLVVRDTVRTPKDLKGKTIALQQYGPHVEYMDQILRDAGMQWSDVTIKWCEELYDTNGRPDDPAAILRGDPSVAAVFCISPDAAALTSNMTTGTGAEGSVKGARVLLTTKTASRVIADVYAVRRDFFDANRDWVEKFVRTHLDSQAAVNGMMKARSGDMQKLLSLGADKLLDNPQATADMEGLLADCTFALAAGNADFFAGTGNLVGFEPTVKRNQSWLVAQNFLTVAQSVNHAKWDYAKFGVTAGAAAPRVAFKEAAAQKAVAESGDQNILFEFEILFGPNQNDFNEAQYGAQFQRALELSATYSGAVLEIVGHSDPYRYLRMKIKEKASEEVLTRQRQAGMNLSLQRSNSVRDSLVAYATSRGITTNPTQFITTGKGYDDPKVPEPRSEDDLVKNRRVQFRIVNIESESAEIFEPLF